jgi:hypothetical protein
MDIDDMDGNNLNGGLGNNLNGVLGMNLDSTYVVNGTNLEENSIGKTYTKYLLQFHRKSCIFRL